MRLAATVMLVRDAAREIEVLMLRRSSASAFMPDAYVFPGGTVDASDRTPALPVGWTPERLQREFRSAVHEELPPDQSPVAADDSCALVHAAVREVHEEAAIELSPGSMHLFSHWITPASEPRRYNTFFFVAPAPAGQPGLADAVETHDARWISPSDAVARARNGSMRIIYPTLMHLERLAAFASVSSLLAFARTKPIVTIMPHGLPEDGFALPAALEGRW
jgi:8-oxo-dGTP pyrophosphatase MutT (NUDIX family)